MKQSKTTTEKLRDLYPLLATGQQVILDGDMQNSCKVTVVRQTPNRMFTTVSGNGEDTWDVMTRRLTPC
jgi:hypothetical protein